MGIQKHVRLPEEEGEQERVISLSLAFILNFLIPAPRVDSFMGLIPTTVSCLPPFYP